MADDERQAEAGEQKGTHVMIDKGWLEGMCEVQARLAKRAGQAGSVAVGSAYRTAEAAYQRVLDHATPVVTVEEVVEAVKADKRRPLTTAHEMGGPVYECGRRDALNAVDAKAREMGESHA